jgi:pimeloyl-ACP methyl ester carboxylesterase
MINRRQFARGLAATAAVTTLAGCASGPAASPPSGGDGGGGGGDDRSVGLRAGSGVHTSLGPITQVDAGVLNVGYAEFGPATGPPVVLLHGWPYDACSYIDVGPLLAASGYRVVVPYLRGYGPTTFRSPDTMRNGQQSAVALDILALMDALKIDKAVLGGYDWGARTVGVIAALWPERCKALVSVSGYLITNLQANQQPLAPAAEYGWWYQYYFATERGVLGYRRNVHDFNRLIWKIASPKWTFDDATYARSAASFDNADQVDVVIHNYRWRLGLAPGEPRYDALEQKLGQSPTISVPTITIASDFDGVAADGSSYRGKFTGRYDHRFFPGIGHNVPQEAPEAFARAVVDADHL